MFAFAVWRTPATPHWPPLVEGPEQERRLGLWGQLLMIGVRGGLVGAGAPISAVGLTSVFFPTDLAFMDTSSDNVRSANAHWRP